ncbi:tryptophan-rich sensory protein [Bizionia saleffrena]|uniref:Tryptophan-rich sensory protein n=1 Tax=Bizionia saleffrena TaxID=291189 RepID=A0A8H2QIT6_9FLAO|nr:TspO/MBR family protein [Bizionia saleffrena]TYB72634.1 tryptophan-rich sensory protein [Bizionia saleffrena]
MKRLKLFFIFLIINFSALGIGSWLMDNGPRSQWYLGLNKAPWTPPGWVFGAAWSTIMVCFSIYLSYIFYRNNSKKVQVIFGLQVILNVIWNFIFFNQHLVLMGLITITALTVVIFYFFFKYKTAPRAITYLLLPYMIWLVIATSLNAYVLVNN